MNKISICIIFYNQQEFVKQSLDSVLAIDFPCDFEILCGDDGSTDGTLDIIKEYANKYPDNIRYFVTDRKETEKSINRASLNRLNLAKNTTGDYIMFLDGDDFYCDKSFIKEAIEVFEKNNNLAVCAFNFKYLHSDNTEEIFNQTMTTGFVNNKKYISNGMYTVSGACVFRNTLDEEKIKILSGINDFDDNAITIYMLQFGDLYYINKPVYTYRQSSDSLWNSINETEQNILNAFDYHLITQFAPKFQKEILKRLFGAIKHLWKKRIKLKKEVKNLEKYIALAEKHQDWLMYNILCYNELDILKKIKIYLKYVKYYLEVKTYKWLNF